MIIKPMKTYAVYELPASLSVDADCFEKCIDVQIGETSGRAILPTLHWTSDKPLILAPVMPPELVKHIKHFIESHDFSWGGVSGWNPKDKLINNAHLSAILLELNIESESVSYSHYLYGRGHPEGDSINALFAMVDHWFNRLRTWAEVVSDQDADPVNPLSHADLTGNGLHVFTIENDVVSLPASPFNITVTFDTSEPLTVAKQASSGLLTNDSHILLRDSNAALRRTHYRRAVIDAGSAVEIALADVNNNITKVRGPRRKTLGWYVLQPSIITYSRLPNNVMKDLVIIRNNAIHQNRIPTYDEAAIAIGLAKQIIDQIAPLSV